MGDIREMDLSTPGSIDVISMEINVHNKLVEEMSLKIDKLGCEIDMLGDVLNEYGPLQPQSI